jgi:hypothetical protein
MTYFLLALGCAVLGALPLIIRKNFLAVIATLVYTVILGIVFYLTTPALIGPLLGWYGFATFMCMVVSLIAAFRESDDHEIFVAALPPAALLIVTLVVEIAGSSMFRHTEYANMIGQLETRQWTQDVQPKDPKHMRMSSKENAINMARNQIGQLGAIGSQFEISDEHATLQMVNHELVWVLPLDFHSLFTWNASGPVPAYIMVDAEDPHKEPKVVKLEGDRAMNYTPGAYMSFNLERHLRSHGYMSKGLIDWSFEIDDQLREWWVVTVYSLVIAGQAEKIEGVVVVNPNDGAATFYATGNVPDWVDRVAPDDLVKEYLEWHGCYSAGWLNCAVWGIGITKPEEPKMVYGSDGQPEWVTSITSTPKSTASDSDKESGSNVNTSLVSMVYTNSRTGKSVVYDIKGGGTDSSIVENVNNNQQVKYKVMHAADPQIYNVYGHAVAVVPLLNANHAYQAVAMVEIANPQNIAVGGDQFEALQSFHKMLENSGRQIALSNNASIQTITAIVERVAQTVDQDGTTFYIYIKGMPHIFKGDIKLSRKLLVTQPGDTVAIEYNDSREDLMPMMKFDNISVPLSETEAQAEVKAREQSKSDGQDTKRAAEATLERIRKLTPDQIKELNKHVPQ